MRWGTNRGPSRFHASPRTPLAVSMVGRILGRRNPHNAGASYVDRFVSARAQGGHQRGVVPDVVFEASCRAGDLGRRVGIAATDAGGKRKPRASPEAARFWSRESEPFRAFDRIEDVDRRAVDAEQAVAGGVGEEQERALFARLPAPTTRRWAKFADPPARPNASTCPRSVVNSTAGEDEEACRLSERRQVLLPARSGRAR